MTAYIIKMMYMYDKAKKRRRRVIKAIMTLIVIICLTTSIVSFAGKNVGPVIMSMGESEVRALATSGINNAIHIIIDENMDYQEFVNIERNNDNEIIMVQLNFVKINRLARDLASLSEASIQSIGEQTIKIPLGAFTGSPVLASYGPPINVGMMPIGTVQCNFISNFDEMGINQTRHRLYIDIKTVISIVLPLAEIPLDINMMVMVVENIIIGKVPETFVKTTQAQLDELNLLP